MKNKGKNKTQSFILEIYSPVHIGSGEELKKDNDFLLEKDSVFVVDVYQTINSIGDDNQLKKYCDGATLKDLINFSKEKYGYHLKSLYPQKNEIRSIREQIKDAFLNPYIPGSSLKGAIRTALWSSVLFEKKDQNNRRLEKEKDVFGDNPQKDVMKSFHVSDGYFSQENLFLGDVRIANKCDNEIRWRNLSSHRNSANKNKDQWKEARGLYAEVLNQGARAEFVFSWDEFLLSDLDSWLDSQNRHLEKVFKSFDHLKQTLNIHALRIIENELDFCNKNNLKEVYKFYEKLKNEIQNSESAYLRMSWGVGRSGMTGITKKLMKTDIIQNFKNSLKQELENNIDNKKRNRIKNILESLKPAKTRRILVQNGSPSLPLGWVKIYPSDNSVKNPYRNEKPDTVDSQFYQKSKFSPWLLGKISELKQKHRIKSDDDVLRGKPLSQEWQAISNKEKKKKIAQEIINHWKKKEWWDDPIGKQKKLKPVYEEIMEE